MNAEEECKDTILFMFQTKTYLPRAKLVTHAHPQTLHGGALLTMTKIREKYWIPKLRRLTKRVIRKCHGCKRFQVKAYADPPTANLPLEKTTGSTPFKVIRVDYAGPIRYLSKTKKEKLTWRYMRAV
jgi:hypothetical protein